MVSLKDNINVKHNFNPQMSCASQAVKLEKPSFLNKESGLNAFYYNSDDEGDSPEPYERDTCKFTDLANFSGDLCDDDVQSIGVDEDKEKFLKKNRRDEDQESEMSYQSKKSGSEKSRSSRHSKKGGTRKKKEKIRLVTEEY